MHSVSFIIELELFLRRFAILLLVDVASLAVLADKLHVIDFFFIGLNPCALGVVPPRASAFVFVVAHDPQRIGDGLAADALVFVIVLGTLYFLLRFLLDVGAFFLPIFDYLASILLLEVVEDDPFEVKGIEEGPFG